MRPGEAVKAVTRGGRAGSWPAALALLCGLQALSGCGRNHTPRFVPTSAPRLTLAVASGDGVPASLPSLVRLVAEQELRRAGLQAGGGGSANGALTLMLERRRGGSNRVHLHLMQGLRGLDSRFDFGRCCAPLHVGELRSQLRRMLATVTRQPPPAPRPLWPGARYTDDHLRNALAAGVHWLVARALRTGAFELSDLQQVFLILRESAADPALRRLGAHIGPRLARRFLRLVPTPRASAPVEQLFDHAAGSYFAARFGHPAPAAYQKALRAAFRTVRPAKLLHRTGKPADLARSLLDELVDLYFPFKLKLRMPTSYIDIVARARRYPFPFGKGEDHKTLEDRTYLATHVVYVLSGFNESALPPKALPQVVRFLERAGAVYLAADDVETLGEVGDALKIVGRDYRSKLLRKIVTRLVERQNPDGSWGDLRDRDNYRRYHTTWTCFNGLLEFRFRRSGVDDARIRRAWTRAQPPARAR